MFLLQTRLRPWKGLSFFLQLQALFPGSKELLLGRPARGSSDPDPCRRRWRLSGWPPCQPRTYVYVCRTGEAEPDLARHAHTCLGSTSHGALWQLLSGSGDRGAATAEERRQRIPRWSGAPSPLVWAETLTVNKTKDRGREIEVAEDPAVPFRASSFCRCCHRVQTSTYCRAVHGTRPPSASPPRLAGTKEGRFWPRGMDVVEIALKSPCSGPTAVL